MSAVTCGPFPQTVKPVIPYPMTDAPYTVANVDPKSGRAISSKGRSRKLLSIEMTFPRRVWSDFDALRAFLESADGRNGRFYFLDFSGWNRPTTVGIYWPKVYVGQGDGSTTTFNLPSYSATSRTLYSNGVALVEAPTTLTRARSGTTVTLVTSTAHGYSTGNTVIITGLGGTGFNGTYVITVTNSTTFTYTSGTSGTVSTTADTGGAVNGPGHWRFVSGGGVADYGGSLAGDQAVIGVAPILTALIYFTFTGRRGGTFMLTSDQNPFQGQTSHITTVQFGILEVP